MSFNDENKNGKKTVSILEASVTDLSDSVIQLQNEFKEEKQKMNNIIIGVLFAAVLIFITIGVEIMIFHTRTDNKQNPVINQYFQEEKQAENLIKDFELINQ